MKTTQEVRKESDESTLTQALDILEDLESEEEILEFLETLDEDTYEEVAATLDEDVSEEMSAPKSTLESAIEKYRSKDH